MRRPPCCGALVAPPPSRGSLTPQLAGVVAMAGAKTNQRDNDRTVSRAHRVRTTAFGTRILANDCDPREQHWRTGGHRGPATVRRAKIRLVCGIPRRDCCATGLTHLPASSGCPTTAIQSTSKLGRNKAHAKTGDVFEQSSMATVVGMGTGIQSSSAEAHGRQALHGSRPQAYAGTCKW